VISIDGKIRIGTWSPAWYLSRAILASTHPTKNEVKAVIAAPWKRSARTDWVWRLRDQDYPPDCFGGTCDTSMGGGWGTELFATEIEAWAYAVGWCRTQLHQRQATLAREVARYADALGETSVGLAQARAAQEPRGAEGQGDGD
jgi:hypothetical protein